MSQPEPNQQKIDPASVAGSVQEPVVPQPTVLPDVSVSMTKQQSVDSGIQPVADETQTELPPTMVASGPNAPVDVHPEAQAFITTHTSAFPEGSLPTDMMPVGDALIHPADSIDVVATPPPVIGDSSTVSLIQGASISAPNVQPINNIPVYDGFMSLLKNPPALLYVKNPEWYRNTVYRLEKRKEKKAA